MNPTNENMCELACEVWKGEINPIVASQFLVDGLGLQFLEGNNGRVNSEGDYLSRINNPGLDFSKMYGQN